MWFRSVRERTSIEAATVEAATIESSGGAASKVGSRLLASIVVSILAVTAVAPSTGSEWKGTEVQVDGVLHVRNPEAPSEGVRDLEMRELWRVGGDDEDVLFGVIAQLVEDHEQNIYLLDSQLHQIQVFSPDGQLVRTFGRQGEGPGEFNNPIDMVLGPGQRLGIVQVFPGKIVQLSTTGDPVGDFPLPPVAGGGIQLVFQARGNDERLLVSGERPRAGEARGVQELYLEAFDAGGTKQVHFHDATYTSQFGGMEFREQIWSNFTRRWDLADDGRVASALDFDAYAIHVWTADGTLDRVIERPGYTPVARSKEEIRRFQRMYDALTRWNPGSSFAVSSTHLTVDRIHFREDGSMWVLAADGLHRAPEGVLASFDVFDRAGRYLRRVHLRGKGDATEDGIFFVGDRVYVVTELLSARLADLGAGEDGGAAEGEEAGADEPEPMSVIAYALEEAAASK